MQKSFYLGLFIICGFLSACTALPKSHLQYIGVWSNPEGYEISIYPDGHGSFKTKSMSGTALITPTTEGFKIGLGPFQRVYIIEQKPYRNGENTFLMANGKLYKKQTWQYFKPEIEIEIKVKNLESAESIPELPKYIENMAALQGKKPNECANSAYAGYWVSDLGDILMVFPSCVGFYKTQAYSSSGGILQIDSQNKQLNLVWQIPTAQSKQDQFLLGLINNLNLKLSLDQEPQNNIMTLNKIDYHKLPNTTEIPLKRKIIISSS